MNYSKNISKSITEVSTIPSDMKWHTTYQLFVDLRTYLWAVCIAYRLTMMFT